MRVPARRMGPREVTLDLLHAAAGESCSGGRRGRVLFISSGFGPNTPSATRYAGLAAKHSL